ncbi:MAG: NuA4 histone H4 acetyltransferase complex and the SWR1 complex subunit [Candelaria pacifica]|nr:MAG: NuA4 histone H4 acetyltransferase complex and the SWR1 complex subunit [Candelaria pacifica]
MPAATGTKRVKGVSIHRPFVFGSIARPIDPDDKPKNLPAEHTHQWTVWVKGVDDEDISYWLKKVQFKLHETYANALRTKESTPFEITETGWGEFEIQIKMHFVPESNEKPQALWHALKLHPYGPDADGQRERREAIVSQNYEEVVFNEPVEQFYEILTGGPNITPKGKGGKGSKQAAMYGRSGGPKLRTAELPERDSPGNPYSRGTEGKELDRMKEAIKKVEGLMEIETKELKEKEARLELLKGSDGVAVKKK